ncbi:Protein REVEILLE [Seminavis robusta]|uniref:Protein REVEILLE n=1 Tax=Seminavis robusta TaxID=568900 RepID=A0A9N8H630_9STRA|nr:Protein REVEILLE [Seminavis robusta]|eukprot:Sro88_g046700.1 Protein REVEILLE (510) ;mRNA; f:107159-108792
MSAPHPATVEAAAPPPPTAPVATEAVAHQAPPPPQPATAPTSALPVVVAAAPKKPPGTAVVASPAPTPVASSTTAAAPAPRSSTSKSKKKKASPVVTMATAAAAQGGSTGAQGENTGRWTAEEHRLFLQGLELHGKGWKKIASLIKSRTVVQIRTHAQKYFQKLAKARQNGEEGEIAMEGRGGPASVTAVSPSIVAQNGKRRRQATGTKRKVIQSVVASATRQGKRFAAVGPDGQPLPHPAPALAHFVLPVAPSNSGSNCVPSITTAQGTISGPALEDSLFRFLTPVPVAAEPQVNEVARSAGANPITLPSENPSAAPSDTASPTGVTELSVYPSWTDAKDTPSWYSKGQDVDALLDVGDTLDWLADSGDLHESYQPPAAVESAPCVPEIDQTPPEGENANAASAQPAAQAEPPVEPNNTDMTVSALPSVDASNVDSVIPPLPSLFDGSTDDNPDSLKPASAVNMDKTMPCDAIDDHLQVFDTPMEEHDFVSTILENTTDSHGDLPALS